MISLPIKTFVDHDARLIRFELSGDLDTAEMLAAVDEALAQARGRGIYDFLSDNRQLQTPATPDQIKQLVGRLVKSPDEVRGSRCAVVVSKEASYGMIRLLAAHADAIGIVVRPFWKVEEAMAFLHRDPPIRAD